MEAPTEMYCLKCRGKKGVTGCAHQTTTFNSKKNGKSMTRDSWVATCSACNKPVRKFCAGAKKEAPIKVDAATQTDPVIPPQ